MCARCRSSPCLSSRVKRDGSAARSDRQSKRAAALTGARHDRDDLHDVVALVGVVGDAVRADEAASRAPVQDHESFV